MTTQTWLANTTGKTEAAAGTAVTLRAAQSGSSKKLTVNSGLISFLQTPAALTMSGYSLTGSQATSLLDMAGTWNTSGNPTALKLNITNTNSGASSNLLDLQVGGVSQFAVSKAGAVTAVGVAIPTISSTSTLTNKTLSSPTLSGTVAGSPAMTGQWQWSGGNDAAYWHAMVLAPTDAGNNKPSFYITHTSPSAYAIGLYDGTDTDGTIQFNCSILNHNGAAITTTSNTQTLTNKTLSNPTITGTISGSPIKIGDGTNAVGMTGTSPLLAVQGASYSTGITVRRDGHAEVGLQSTGTGNIGTWSAHDVLFIRNGTQMGGFDSNTLFVGQVASPRVALYNNSGTASTLTLGADSGDTFLGSFTNAQLGIYTNSTKRINIPAAGGFELIDGNNLLVGTTTGSKIGTSTSQKLGFFNATPVVQPTAVADATDAASVITQLNALLTRMRNLGLIAT